jgi:hypothetical protein
MPGPILQTLLGHLAGLFLTGAGGNQEAAEQAAASLLAAYQPETQDELRLAAQIVGFSFHALEALTQTATPEMPLNRILRLRGSAVSLSRESHKAQRRLDERQKSRREGTETPAESPQPSPGVEKALAVVDDTKKVAAMAKATGLTWTQAYHQHQRAARVAEKLKKDQARQAACHAPACDAPAATTGRLRRRHPLGDDPAQLRMQMRVAGHDVARRQRTAVAHVGRIPTGLTHQ